MAFSRGFFRGTPLCRYFTPDVVIKPEKKEKEKKEGDEDDEGDEGDDDSDSDDSDGSYDSGEDSDEYYSGESGSYTESGSGARHSSDSKKIIIRKRVTAVVHSSMNRLTGGQAKNERDIMIQLKSTVHGGGALDDMPNAVSDSDDMALFASMIDGTIVLVDSINYVMDEPVEANKETVTHLFLAKRNQKMVEDPKLTGFDHLGTVGYDAKDGPRALKIWTVIYNLEKVVAPPHLKGRAAERYIRRGPKYFRKIGLEVLMEVNLGNAEPIETKMIGNVFAFTRHDVEYIEMYALKSPEMQGELIRYLDPRAENAHAAVPNSLDANDTLMIFVSTSLGGNVKIWGAQNNLLRNIYFDQDRLYGAGFINKKGDLLISYDGILLCVPADAYLTPFIVEEMLNDETPFEDDISAKPLVRLSKAKSALLPKTMADTPTFVVCSGERKQLMSLEGEGAPEAETTRRRKDFGEQEGVQLKLEKKKKVEEEKPKEEGEYGPFGYLYKRVIVDPEKSWIEGLTNVRDHYMDKLHHLPKIMTRENRRAYKHYDYSIVRALEFLDEKLEHPHHKAIDEHFFVPTPDYMINQTMLDKLQKEVEDKERHYKRITTIPPEEEQRLTNLRALAIAVEGDEALEQKARYQLSTIRNEMGSIRYPATFRDHILGKWTQLSPEEIEAIMIELMKEHIEEQKRKKEMYQNEANGTGGAPTTPAAVVAAPAEENPESQNQNRKKRENNNNNNYANKIDGKNNNKSVNKSDGRSKNMNDTKRHNDNNNNYIHAPLILPPIRETSSSSSSSSCSSSPSSPSSSPSSSSQIVMTLPRISSTEETMTRQPEVDSPKTTTTTTTTVSKRVTFAEAETFESIAVASLSSVMSFSTSSSSSNILPIYSSAFSDFWSPPTIDFRRIPRGSSTTQDDVDETLRRLGRGRSKTLRQLLQTQRRHNMTSPQQQHKSNQKFRPSLMWNEPAEFDASQVEEFLNNVAEDHEWFHELEAVSA